MWELALKFPIESCGTFITILPITTFLIRAAYHKKAVRFFFIYLVVKLLIELVMFYMASRSQNNLYLGNILTIISYFLIAKMFHEAYDGKGYKVAVVWLSALFSCIVLIDIIRDSIYYTFRYSGMIQCILIMLYALMYFHELVRHPKIPDLFKFPFFWLCSSLILYFSSSVFIAPLGFYLDRWPVNHQMYVFTLIPSILESAYLFIAGLGIMAGRG